MLCGFSRVITSYEWLMNSRQHLLALESLLSFRYFWLKRISCSFKHRNISLCSDKSSITNNCSLDRSNRSEERPSWFTNISGLRALLHVREALTSPCPVTYSRPTQQPLSPLRHLALINGYHQHSYTGVAVLQRNACLNLHVKLQVLNATSKCKHNVLHTKFKLKAKLRSVHKRLKLGGGHLYDRSSV
jgi:hypothetical protein